MNKKNILMIIVDEMRADCMGALGNPLVKTTAMDQLAADGVLFSQHFAPTTKCVPARASLYTGRYAHLDGHRTLGVEVQPGEINLASLLKEQGYFTAMFQRNHSIDESWHDQVFDHWGKAESLTNPHFIRQENISQSESNAFYWGIIDDQAYRSADRVHTDLLLSWLRNYKQQQPFFVNLNTLNPHPPYNAEKRLTDLYELESIEPFPVSQDPGRPLFMQKIPELYGDLEQTLTDNLKRKIIQAYYAQITACDELIGEILETLHRLNLYHETIILVLSDHGDYVGQYNLVEKWDTGFQDCLIHVPLIMAGGGLPEGVTVQGFTEHVDIMPTLCELLEIESPYGMSGQSFCNMIENPKLHNKNYVFCEGGHEEELLQIVITPEEMEKITRDSYRGKARLRNLFPNTLRKAKMVRTAEYKYIYRVMESDELYDLKKDPWELKNVIHDRRYAQIAAELKELLLHHLVENEEKRPFDPFPIA